jgi:transcriptional regulator with XRE-family HTH domain
MKHLVEDEQCLDVFGKRLRQARQNKGYSRSQLAFFIDRNTNQVQRYENEGQLPPLGIFAKICIELQADPLYLLGLKYADAKESPEIGIVSDWTLRRHHDSYSLKWKCPGCDLNNVQYGIIKSRRKMSDKKLNKMMKYCNEFLCEGCGRFFDKLLGVHTK